MWLVVSGYLKGTNLKILVRHDIEYKSQSQFIIVSVCDLGELVNYYYDQSNCPPSLFKFCFHQSLAANTLDNLCIVIFYIIYADKTVIKYFLYFNVYNISSWLFLTNICRGLGLWCLVLLSSIFQLYLKMHSYCFKLQYRNNKSLI